MSVLSDAFSLKVSYLFVFENSVTSVPLVTLSLVEGERAVSKNTTDNAQRTTDI